MRLGGDRTGKRVVVCEQLELHGLTDPFDVGDLVRRTASRCSARTGRARATSCACSRASRSSTTATWRLGARVVPGYFSQTHDQPELRGVAVLDVVMQAGHRSRAGDGLVAPLRAARLRDRQPFETLSGGQQARLQILLLELSGANLLLLDEPTDNLDLASAEALEEALDVVRRHRAWR